MPDRAWRELAARRPRLDVETIPAVAAALWLIPGIVGAVLGATRAVPFFLLLPALALYALAAWAFLRPPGQRFAWLIPAGAVLTLLHLAAPWQTYRGLLPRPECGAEVEGVVTAPVFAADLLPALTPPATVEIALHRVRFGSGEPWQDCSGRVLLRLESDPNGEKAIPAYGTTIRSTGAFILPDGPLFPGDFDYPAFLRTNGIHRLFLAADTGVVGPCRGWRRLPAAMLRLRDLSLQRMTAGLESPAHAELLAAVLFGGCNGLPPELRARYLQSGTIHIFSVSGLHVVILSSILLLGLKLARVPFRTRHLLLPPLLGLYVLMAGSAPAACRAWVMMTVWALARGFLLPVKPLNSVATAALLLLAWNPLYLFQTGFQFSFVLVFFLVYGWNAAGDLRNALLEKEGWCPGSARTAPLLHRFWGRVVDVLGGSLVGWLAAAGLMAWTSGRFVVSCLFTNLVVGFTTWWVMVLAGAKLVLSATLSPMLWRAPEKLATRGVDLAIRLTDLAADWGRGEPGSLPLPHPPLVVVLLFYLLLLVVFGRSLPLRLRGVAAAVLAAGVALAPLSRRLTAAPPDAVLFTGDGSSTPGLIWFAAPDTPPLLLLPDSYRLTRSMGQWLVLHGYADAGMVWIGPGVSPAAAGALVSGLRVHTLLLPGNSAPGQSALRTQLRREGVRLRTLDSGAEPVRIAAGWTAAWSSSATARELHLNPAKSAAGAGLALVTRLDRGGTVLTLSPAGKKAPQVLSLPLRLRPDVYPLTIGSRD